MDRATLHHLVDELPEGRLSDPEVLRALGAEPLLIALAGAPTDDEPDDRTPEERAEVEDELRSGQVHAWEDVKRELRRDREQGRSATGGELGR